MSYKINLFWPELRKKDRREMKRREAGKEREKKEERREGGRQAKKRRKKTKNKIITIGIINFLRTCMYSSYCKLYFLLSRHFCIQLSYNKLGNNSSELINICYLIPWKQLIERKALKWRVQITSLYLHRYFLYLIYAGVFYRLFSPTLFRAEIDFSVKKSRTFHLKPSKHILPC